MKKIKLCPHCKSVIDKNATWCAACGKALPGTKMFLRIVSVVIFLAIFAIIGIMSEDDEKTGNKKETQIEQNEITEEEYKATCKEYKYKDVLRNPEEYIGKKVVITVKISTVFSESWSNPVKYYFANSESEPESGYYWGDRYAIFDKRSTEDDLKLLEDDVIKVWGEIVEPEETTSLIVNPEEVFCIDMKYVELISE